MGVSHTRRRTSNKVTGVWEKNVSLVDAQGGPSAFYYPSERPRRKLGEVVKPRWACMLAFRVHAGRLLPVAVNHSSIGKRAMYAERSHAMSKMALYVQSPSSWHGRRVGEIELCAFK